MNLSPYGVEGSVSKRRDTISSKTIGKEAQTG